ncbi:MAG: ATP-binding protein [Parasporobacterium sp.]|nr:ATP-binding protein [Parasporobacterium sp.]
MLCVEYFGTEGKPDDYEEIVLEAKAESILDVQDLVGVLCDFKNRSIEITFKDRGVEFNPLDKNAPDVTLAARKRKIGGLGIFVVRNTMDDMTYEYKDGQNILKIKKFV